MPNCYYYDEQHNHCNCYVNKNLNELLAENAKLREMALVLRRCLDGCMSDEDCKGCPMLDADGWCNRDVKLDELLIEVGK